MRSCPICGAPLPGKVACTVCTRRNLESEYLNPVLPSRWTGIHVLFACGCSSLLAVLFVCGGLVAFCAGLGTACFAFLLGSWDEAYNADRRKNNDPVRY